MIFHQFADRTHTTIAQVVNIINFTSSVFKVYQDLHNFQDIFFAKHTNIIGNIGKVKPCIHLNTTDRRQIIAFVIKEKPVEQSLCRIQGWRLAGAHYFVNINKRFLAASILIRHHSIADVRTDICVVNVKNLQLICFTSGDICHFLFGQFFAGFQNYLTGSLINQVGSNKLAHHIGFLNANFFQAVLLKRISLRHRNFYAGFQNNLAILGINQVVSQLHTFPHFGDKGSFPTFFVTLIKHFGIEI